MDEERPLKPKRQANRAGMRPGAIAATLIIASGLAAAPPVVTDHFDYVAWDSPTSHWSAKLAADGKSFLRAPDGDWKRARPDTMINYVAQNGTEWSAEIRDGRFLNSARGALVSFQSSEMIYRSWTGVAYSIELDAKNKRFLQSAVKVSKGKVSKH